MKRVWAHACGVRKATSLFILVSCPRGQEVNTQAAPGTLTRQRYWQGRGWPGSPDPALAPGWPGTLRAVRELHTAGRGGLAGSSQGVGCSHPPLFPHHAPLCFTTSHRLGSVCGWMEQSPGTPWPLACCRPPPGGLGTVLFQAGQAAHRGTPRAFCVLLINRVGGVLEPLFVWSSVNMMGSHKEVILIGGLLIPTREMGVKKNPKTL